MKFRRCIHQLEDGTICSQSALKNSPRCRHHQFNARQNRRRHAAKQAGFERRGDFIMQTLSDILSDPQANLIDELRATQRLRKIDWIDSDDQLAINDFLAFHKSILRKFPLPPTALQYFLNNENKVRQ